MLQQTRVDQAIPYYNRFVDQYPDVHALASAELDEVLKQWEGLGYYARARNLHRAAQRIVRENGGEFPIERRNMLSLPGVGGYTANAVLSISRGLPLAVVDGNVARVLSRLFEVDTDIRSSAGIRQLQQIADQLLDEDAPGSFNEALMELGATVCLPNDPSCKQCPIGTVCAAFGNGTVGSYPQVRRKAPLRVEEVAAAIIVDAKGRVFIQRRSDDGLLGGLWEFPGGKIEPGETAEAACRREVREELGLRVEILEALPIVRHAYSHFKVVISPFFCRGDGQMPQTKLANAWIRRGDLHGYAMPGATRKIIRLMEHTGSGHGDLFKVA